MKIMETTGTTPPTPPAQTAAYLGVGLVSAAMLVFELALTRVFAVIQFHHFAFMAISLALMGAGVSGSLLTVWRRRTRPATLAAGFALTTLGSYLLINYVELDPYAIAWNAKELAPLAVNFLSAVVPFTLSGLVVAQLLESEAGRAHRVYAANLAGSAAGCVAVLPALALFGGEGTVLLAAAMGFAAAATFARARLTRAALLALTVAGLAGAVAPPAFMDLRLSQYKGLVSALRAPDAAHVSSQWNAVARVDVVESRSIHSMMGLSMNARIDPPPQSGVTLDGENLMPITHLDPDGPEAAELARWLPLGVPFALRPNADALVVEPGGGFDVLVALAAGAGRVTVAEDNALLIDAVGTLYTDPRVEAVNEDGRAFARRTGDRFDVVDVALTDGFRPVTSGAYSLSENYQYTVEAFVDYLERLDDDGLLFAMRWLQTPPSEDARTFAIILKALERFGAADPAGHIAAYRSGQLMAFIVGRQPLAAGDIAAIRDFTERARFDLVLLPGLRPDEVNRYAIFPEPVYHDLYTAILAGGAAVWQDYEYDISPPTDDRPFFYHYFRWSQTPEVIENLGKEWRPFGGSGYLVLLLLLALVGAASVVLIFGPLAAAKLRRRTSDGPAAAVPAGLRLRTFAYFTLLGLAFLFVEMPLAQRFIVFVGHPITALAVVLFAVLLFSGLGSLTMPRWRRLWMALGALAALAAVYPLVLPAVFDAAFGAPLWLRVLVSLALIAPLGVLMGVPFARGLRIVEARAPGLTPWAWAINGCASVVSAILAVMLAISWGFSAVLWLGAACYGGALLAMWGMEGET